MAKTDEAPFSYEGLDRIIHEKATARAAHLAHRAFQGSGVRRPEAALRPHRRQPLPPPPGAAGGGPRRDHQGLREQPAPHELPADPERPPALPQLSRRARAPRPRRQGRGQRHKAAGNEDARMRGSASFPSEPLFLRGNFVMQSASLRQACALREAARRHHHGRQRALGDAALPAAPRRARSRRRGGAARRRGGAEAGHRHAHALRVLERQLAAAQGRGRGADEAVALLSQGRDRHPRAQRRPPHRDRPPRPPARRPRERDHPRRGFDRARRCAPSARRARLFRTRRDPRGRRPHRFARRPHPRRASPASSPASPALRDVDLIIRTSGEKRLSDFLLWESAYAELHFTERMWPDFDAPDLAEALASFRRRERRFGGLQAQPSELAFGAT